METKAAAASDIEIRRVKNPSPLNLLGEHRGEEHPLPWKRMPTSPAVSAKIRVKTTDHDSYIWSFSGHWLPKSIFTLRGHDVPVICHFRRTRMQTPVNNTLYAVVASESPNVLDFRARLWSTPLQMEK